MTTIPGLTIMQEGVALAAMLEEGISEDVANNVLAVMRERMGTPPRSGSVTVTQTAHTVEAGATVVGYRADRIG